MICPPEHGRHHARGRCRRCYHARRRAEARAGRPLRRPPSLTLAARAEKLHAELVEAGPYAMVPPTWRGVAEMLGVRYETLDRARCRAKHYAEREAA
jgi:hypothetical protein